MARLQTCGDQAAPPKCSFTQTDVLASGVCSVRGGADPCGAYETQEACEGIISSECELETCAEVWPKDSQPVCGPGDFVADRHMCEWM